MNDGDFKVSLSIEDTVRKYQMFPKEGKIVAGVSGGADSMTLAHFLLQNYRERLVIAHVNHMLRGEESDRDEAYVREWSNKNGVPFQCLRVDVKKESQKKKIGEEECGRELRYAFFNSLVKEENDRIATAHTASDSSETVLFHLARGTALPGLCGILPVRGRLVRPLIELTRKDTEAYCSFYGLSYVTDSTNLVATHSRNKIRLELVPFFKELNPSFDFALTRMTGRLHEDEEFLSSTASAAEADAFDGEKYDTSKMRLLHNAILSRVCILAAKRFGSATITEQNVSDLEDAVKNGGTVTLPGGVSLVSSCGFLHKRPQNKEKNFHFLPFKMPETLTWDGRKFIIEKVLGSEKNQYKINKLLFFNSLDYDTITQDPVLRTRRDGDIFRPANRNVTKTLKKLFCETKIPVEQRDRLLVLEICGEIAWIENFGVSERFSVRDNTKNIAHIIIRENGEDT